MGRRGSDAVFSRLSPSSGLIASDCTRRQKSWPGLLFSNKQKGMTMYCWKSKDFHSLHTQAHSPPLLSLRDKEMVKMGRGGRSWSWWVWMIACFRWSFALLWFHLSSYSFGNHKLGKSCSSCPVWFYVGLYKHIVFYSGSSMINYAFI